MATVGGEATATGNGEATSLQLSQSSHMFSFQSTESRIPKAISLLTLITDTLRGCNSITGRGHLPDVQPVAPSGPDLGALGLHGT